MDKKIAIGVGVAGLALLALSKKKPGDSFVRDPGGGNYCPGGGGFVGPGDDGFNSGPAGVYGPNNVKIPWDAVPKEIRDPLMTLAQGDNWFVAGNLGTPGSRIRVPPHNVAGYTIEGYAGTFVNVPAHMVDSSGNFKTDTLDSHSFLGEAVRIATELYLLDRAERGLDNPAIVWTTEMMEYESERRKEVQRGLGILDPCGLALSVHTGSVQLTPEEALKIESKIAEYIAYLRDAGVTGLPALVAVNVELALMDGFDRERAKWEAAGRPGGTYRETRQNNATADWFTARDMATQARIYYEQQGNPELGVQVARELLELGWYDPAIGLSVVKYENSPEEFVKCKDIPCDQVREYGQDPANAPWKQEVDMRQALYDNVMANGSAAAKAAYVALYGDQRPVAPAGRLALVPVLEEFASELEKEAAAVVGGSPVVSSGGEFDDYWWNQDADVIAVSAIRNPEVAGGAARTLPAGFLLSYEDALHGGISPTPQNVVALGGDAVLETWGLHASENVAKASPGFLLFTGAILSLGSILLGVFEAVGNPLAPAKVYAADGDETYPNYDAYIPPTPGATGGVPSDAYKNFWNSVSPVVDYNPVRPQAYGIQTYNPATGAYSDDVYTGTGGATSGGWVPATPGETGGIPSEDYKNYWNTVYL